MKINLENLGKRYNKEWIFKGLTYEFISDNAYVILGANGSGKSTLLQVIAGNFLFSEGGIKYQVSGIKTIDSIPFTTTIERENIFQYISFASPYLELLEEYTLWECIVFHSKFKNFQKHLSSEKILELCELKNAKDKAVKHFSSGMKQRVRLALAILSDTPLLLLDEPCSNLDKNGIQWYQNLVQEYSKNRLVIVCSNQQEYEYGFCNKELKIEEYKN